MTTFSVMTMLSKTEAMRLRYNALVVVSNCNGLQQHRGPERLGALNMYITQHDFKKN